MSKRIIRSKEERLAEMDRKIDYHKRCIVMLEEKRTVLMKQDTKRQELREIKRFMDENNISLQQLQELMQNQQPK